MAQDPRDASGTWGTAGRLVCNGCYKARATRSEIFQKFYPPAVRAGDRICTECVVPAHMHCRRSDDILVSNAAQVSTRIIGLVPNRAQQQHHERAHQLTISCDAPEPTRDLTRDFRYKPDNIFLMLSRMPHELGRLVGSAEFQGPLQLVRLVSLSFRVFWNCSHAALLLLYGARKPVASLTLRHPSRTPSISSCGGVPGLIWHPWWVYLMIL